MTFGQRVLKAKLSGLEEIVGLPFLCLLCTFTTDLISCNFKLNWPSERKTKMKVKHFGQKHGKWAEIWLCEVASPDKRCDSKDVTESLNRWPHLGDGVSSTRPESQIVRVIFFLECFDSWAELRRLHHQGVARDWETQWHFCYYTLYLVFISDFHLIPSVPPQSPKWCKSSHSGNTAGGWLHSGVAVPTGSLRILM